MTTPQKFNSVRKKCVVMEIGDIRTHSSKVNGYAIFDDNWITPYDKVMYDEQDNEYPVLDFQEIEREVCEYPELIQFARTSGITGYVTRHYSCLKIEGAKVGDIFYTHNFKPQW